MGRVILFDRGEAGGLLLDSSGVRTVPRFAPEIRANLRAVLELLRAADAPASDASRELATLVTKVANIAVDGIERATGALDPGESLVYLDEDGGFVCGGTGAPPRPIKWPPQGGRPSKDLLATGILPPDLVEFLGRSAAQGLDLPQLLEDPLAAAKKLNFRLSALAAETLKGLAPSELPRFTDPVEHEVVGFFHAVIKDGRFLETWAVQPAAAAAALGVKLSNAAIDKILGGSATVGRPSDVANLSIEQGIVVGVVAIVLVVVKPRLGDFVVDRSGKEKF